MASIIVSVALIPLFLISHISCHPHEVPADPFAPFEYVPLLPDPSSELSQPKPVIHETAPIEKLTNVVVGYHQITVHTNTSGLHVDNLVTEIEMTDLKSGRKIHRRWDGLLLHMTWGKYQIDGLEPNTWWGIHFRSKTMRPPEYVHTDYQIIRTLIEPGIVPDPIVDTAPALVNEAQKQVVTLTANSSATDLFNVVIRSDLICQTTNESKIIRLSDAQQRNSLQFAIRRVVERKVNSTEVVARLADETCHKLCWSVWLVALIDNSRYEYSRNCTNVSASNLQVSIREFVSAVSEGSHVTIITDYSSIQPETEAEVTINVQELGGLDEQNENENDENSLDYEVVEIGDGDYADNNNNEIDGNELSTPDYIDWSTTDFYTTLGIKDYQQIKAEPGLEVSMSATTKKMGSTSSMNHQQKMNNKTIVNITNTFNAKEGNFTIDGLKRNTWYVLNYSYAIREPIEYTDFKIHVFRVTDPEEDQQSQTRVTKGTRASTSYAGSRQFTEEPLAPGIHRSASKPTSDPYDFQIKISESLMNFGLRRTNALRKHNVTARLLPFCGQDGEAIILNPGAATEWVVNVSEAIAVFESTMRAAARRQTDGGNSSQMYIGSYPESVGQMSMMRGQPVGTRTINRINFKNCDQICWNYEMVLPNVKDAQTMNEQCRKFSDIWQEWLNDNTAPQANSLAKSCVLLVIVITVHNICFAGHIIDLGLF